MRDVLTRRARVGTLSPVIEVVGVPFDLCGKRLGSRLGPAAVRLAGLVSGLEGLGLQVRDTGDLTACEPASIRSGPQNFPAALQCLIETKRVVGEVLGRGSMPLVLGGEHSVSIGSISAALERFERGLAVLWIDAHADLNTPGVSPSGNLHGMPLAALLGLPAGVDGQAGEDWSRLLAEVVPASRLKSNQAAWVGLRDVDQGEREHYRQIRGEFTATMYDVDRHGIVEVMSRFDRWMRESKAEALWISFDVDSLDPFLAPGTGTAVRGGLTYREMHLMGEMLHEMLAADGCPYRLAGLDLVEVNPLVDTNNETAVAATEWVGSVLGKTILGKR
jgi:arginase